MFAKVSQSVTKNKAFIAVAEKLAASIQAIDDLEAAKRHLQAVTKALEELRVQRFIAAAETRGLCVGPGQLKFMIEVRGAFKAPVVVPVVAPVDAPVVAPVVAPVEESDHVLAATVERCAQLAARMSYRGTFLACCVETTLYVAVKDTDAYDAFLRQELRECKTLKTSDGREHAVKLKDATDDTFAEFSSNCGSVQDLVDLAVELEERGYDTTICTCVRNGGNLYYGPADALFREASNESVVPSVLVSRERARQHAAWCSKYPRAPIRACALEL